MDLVAHPHRPNNTGNAILYTKCAFSHGAPRSRKATGDFVSLQRPFPCRIDVLFYILDEAEEKHVMNIRVKSSQRTGRNGPQPTRCDAARTELSAGYGYVINTEDLGRYSHSEMETRAYCVSPHSSRNSWMSGKRWMSIRFTDTDS